MTNHQDKDILKVVMREAGKVTATVHMAGTIRQQGDQWDYHRAQEPTDQEDSFTPAVLI